MAQSVLLTLAAAVAGGLIALRLKIPAGAMIGAMVAVAALNISTVMVYLSPHCKILTQAIAGGFIGLSMDRETLAGLKRLLAPAVFLAVFMQLQGVVIGYAIHTASPIDLTTALLSSAPGGIVDMSLIGMDMGADTSTVAVLHTVRLTAVLLFCPQIIRVVAMRYEHLVPPEEGREKAEKPAETQLSTHPLDNKMAQTLITAGLALLCGFLGYKAAIPAGVILFSLSGVSALSIATHRAYLPGKLRRAAQILAGAVIGKDIGMEQVLQMRFLVVPALIIVSIYLVGNFVAGMILKRAFHIDLVTGMFASTPAGVSDMTLLADDIGASGSDVAVLQIVRLISVIALFPQITAFLVR